ncbi:putative transposase [Chitinophaga costaii]|uniref:Putative transposase n=1 Tax=Chitinophaga costaii TaxID=1335309 RepID=A0A1C4GAD5_9BACT|nr:transposase [Chitinophaga costaii]PUZ19709.1 hypothetical protein DCM91_20290 [Chitinophaga costaii]SCC64785.1 putative transposase [Chitinophaga costaii]
MTKKSRRKFSGDFKAKVVQEALKERSTVEELAKKYELHPTQINTWKREAAAKLAGAFDADSSSSNNEQQEEKLEKLYAQIGQLKVENDFIKKIAVAPLQRRRNMIETQHDILSVRQQCQLLNLHRSGLYYQPVAETSENLAIMRFLDEQYYKTAFYGERRLTVLLRSSGYHVNRKCVRRLMKVRLSWPHHRSRTVEEYYRDDRPGIPQ